MKAMKENSLPFYFVKKTYPYAIFIAVVIFVLYRVITNDVEPNRLFFDIYLDEIISVTTALIACAIWFVQHNSAWRESLPKRLTVHFEYEGKIVLSCYEAFLSGEGDIRAWSQQLYMQMTGARMNIYPYMNIEKKKPSESAFVKGQKIQLYEAWFFLTDYKPDKKQISDPTKYLVWYNNTDILKNIDELVYDKQPQVPKTAHEIIVDHNEKLKKLSESTNVAESI